jgi:hypothetical protein
MVFDKVIFNEASFTLKGGAMINRSEFQRDNFILSVVFFQSKNIFCISLIECKGFESSSSILPIANEIKSI